jgi:uridine kinase
MIPSKIAIAGGNGAGKTTLGRQLAELVGRV